MHDQRADTTSRVGTERRNDRALGDSRELRDGHHTRAAEKLASIG